VLSDIKEVETLALEESPRRRRRTAQPQQQAEEHSAQEPRRIVVSMNDEPDWMVSASRVSGAAERRGGSAAKPSEKKPEADSGYAQESRAILQMQKKAAAPQTSKTAAKKPPAQQRSTTAKTAPKAKKESVPIVPKKLSKKAKARRKAKIRQGVIAILITALFTVLLTVGVMGGSRLVDIKKTLDQGSSVFYPNIFVNNIPLAGKTLDEAAAIVTQQVSNLISSWKITLRTQDGRSWDITGRDLKMKYDVADQLDQLWAIGHTGSASERYEQVKALEETPAVRYTTLSYDLSSVNQILTQIKSEVDKPPVSATRVNDETKWPPYSYTDDVAGQQLDISGLNERIAEMVDKLESGVVDLTPTPVQAPVTRAYLESQIVKLAEFETSIGKTGDYVEARHENIRIGTEKFNKLIIKSGESVSFNKVAGKRTASNGYQPALELAYGEYVEGYGGGICQVSSTLYNAVVNAGLSVTKRTQHSLPSNYVPLGLDATVQDDRLDFVFKNTTNADIFISTEYYKNKKNYWTSKFIIHGRPDPDGYTYKLESEVAEEIPIPEPTYIPDKDAKYVVYDDEQKQTSEGQEGHIVNVYLVTMDKNGLEVSRELKYTDTYKTVQPKIYVGVTPRETPVPPEELLWFVD